MNSFDIQKAPKRTATESSSMKQDHDNHTEFDRETSIKSPSSNTRIYHKQPLKSPIRFWLMINFGAFLNFLVGYNIGLFNTLGDHMPFIYNWTDSQFQLNYTLINSLPQAVAGIVCLFIGNLASRIGRRKTLMIITFVGLSGNALTLLADTIALQLGRILVGAGLGGWSSIGPLYTIELAPRQFKGLAGILYSLHFGFGILLSFLLGYGLPLTPSESATNSYWRIMLGLPIFLCTAVILLFLIVYRNDTTTFIMIHTRDEEKVHSILDKQFVSDIALEEFSDLKSFSSAGQNSAIGWKELFGQNYRSRVILITIFTLGFSYTGCNAVNIYSYSIIQETQGDAIAQLFTTIMPIGDIIGPCFAALLIGKIGRKNLYLHGLGFCAITVLGVSLAGWLKVVFLQKYLLFLFKVIFASSTAPVHWIYPSEIMPPVGVGYFGFAYWMMSLSTVIFLPYMIAAVGVEITFIIFPIITILIMIFLAAKMKETTGKGKKAIEEMFRFDGDLTHHSENIHS